MTQTDETHDGGVEEPGTTQSEPDSTTRSATAANEPAEPSVTGGLYEFCATVLADPPAEELVERLRTEGGPTLEAAPNARLETGFDALRRWADEVDDVGEATRELERAHTRLFVGPRPKLQIHESYYADDFLGRPLAVVQGTYTGLGIEPAEDSREEVDHAAVELATLAILSDREPAEPEAKDLFVHTHGWWFDELAADLEEIDAHPFYRAVGSIAAGLVQFDAERAGIDLEELESPSYIDHDQTA